MPLRRATATPSAPAQPVNTDWQTMAVVQGLDWLYPLDGRMDGSYPLNLVSSPPHAPSAWRTDNAKVSRHQRLILDGMGYQWSRKVESGNPSLYDLSASGISGLRLEPRNSNPDGSFCAGVTLSFPIPINTSGVSTSWFLYGIVKGLEWSFDFGGRNLYGGGGSFYIYNFTLSDPLWLTPIRIGWQCNPSGESFIFLDGIRRISFTWNRSATHRSGERFSVLGLIGADANSQSRGVILRDWWAADGFRDADFMQTMGGL